MEVAHTTSWQADSSQRILFVSVPFEEVRADLNKVDNSHMGVILSA
jgi:thiamine biosynthesis protein ThiI